MSNPPSARITCGNQILDGPVQLSGIESLWNVLHFSHEVGDGHLRFDGYCGSWVHYHKPMSLTLELDRFAPLFYSTICRDETLDKIEIFWPSDTPSRKANRIYFITTIYPVKISSVRQFFPNIKDPVFFNYGHLIEMSFRYRWIEWEYTLGKHWVKREWVEYILDSFHIGDERERRELEKMVSGTALTDNLQIDVGREISVQGTGWEHLNEELKNSRPQKAWKGEMIRLFAEVKGICDGETVSFELYYKNPEENSMQFTNVSGKVEDGTAEVDWVVDLWGIRGKKFEIWFEPVVRGRYGGKCGIGLARRLLVPWFVDCHMHINPCKAAPLPVVWIQNFMLNKLKSTWETMEKEVVKSFIRWFQHDLPDYVGLSTEELGHSAIKESKKVLEDTSFDEFMGPSEKRARLLVNMPMDMEFANYWGYDGKTVYQQDENGGAGYWKYEKVGKREWYKLPSEEIKKLYNYKKQMLETGRFFRKNNDVFLSLFHYDPRRWTANAESDWSGDWDVPFKHIIQVSDSSVQVNIIAAIGFKMYTALGYRPDDYKDVMAFSIAFPNQKRKIEAKLPDLYKFYSKCEKYQIPIVCHGSRGGIFAHDRNIYYDYLFPGDNVDKSGKRDFYCNYYISPFAWERVLQDFPELKLCLAHFGGEESWESDELLENDWACKMVEMVAGKNAFANMYIDISYFLIKNEVIKSKFKKLLSRYPNLKKKILFGTDWYLVGSERSKFGKYDNYVNGMFQNLNDIDEELAAYAMVLNPVRFYDLEHVSEKIENLSGADNSGLKKILQTIPRTIDAFEF